MKSKQAAELLEKYRKGETLTEDERAIIESWYLHLARANEAKNLDGDELVFELDAVWEEIKLKNKTVKGPFKRRIKNSWLAAASVVLLIATGLFLFNPKKEQPQLVVKTPKTDAAPGGNRAFLTLADNTKISLDDASAGEIARQAGISITKKADGKLVYNIAADAGNESAVQQYNTIETPRGGQYQVNLPDGTSVWLNSVSSIRFPTRFSKTERNVEITGEVYFEVAKNKLAPFTVKTGNQKIVVLGTHFNVNAYTDEAEIKTTLLEGSVLVTQGQNQKVRLNPGQQSVASHSPTGNLLVKEADIQAAVAWKNGYFHFNQSSLPELMRQFARWYQVDVEYKGAVKNYEFVGKIGRDKSLSKVLNILKESGVNFKLEDNKLTVTP